jgi:hypothetical protein
VTLHGLFAAVHTAAARADLLFISKLYSEAATTAVHPILSGRQLGTAMVLNFLHGLARRDFATLATYLSLL